LFETYVPFRFDGEDHVSAVIEVYQDYSVIQSEIDRLTRTLSISLGIGLLVLYAVLLPLMIGITRTLRRQNHRLQEQADQLSDLLEREQDTVAELRELDRMKSDFVAATSHELRTPLTSIRGYVHILRGSALAGDPVAVEALAAIERQSSRLFRLIGNVLRESNLTRRRTRCSCSRSRISSTGWWPISTRPASASSARSPRIFLRSRWIGAGCRTCSSTWWTTR
jgi:signal transduction histidine kinase